MIKIANNLLNLLYKAASDTSRPLPPDGGFKQTWTDDGQPIMNYGDTLPTSYTGAPWDDNTEFFMPSLEKPHRFDAKGWKSYSKMMTPEEYASRVNSRFAHGWPPAEPGEPLQQSDRYHQEANEPKSYILPLWARPQEENRLAQLRSREEKTWADYLQRTTPTTPTTPTPTISDEEATMLAPERMLLNGGASEANNALDNLLGYGQGKRITTQ